MLNIVGLDIEINRGNAAGLTFHFEGEDAPEDGTKVLFQVRPAAQYDYSVIEKEVEVLESKLEISLLPEDTASLRPGDYYWNACIQFSDGLDPWTVMRDWQHFTVLPG